MTNAYSKNIPYISGALASIALLTSVVFAVAPYINFLASIAALSVSTSLIISCIVFSAITIALAY